MAVGVSALKSTADARNPTLLVRELPARRFSQLPRPLIHCPATLFERAFLNHKASKIGFRRLLALAISVTLFNEIIKRVCIAVNVFFAFIRDKKYRLLTSFLVNCETFLYKSIVRYKVADFLTEMVILPTFKDYEIGAFRFQPLSQHRNQLAGSCPVRPTPLEQRFQGR